MTKEEVIKRLVRMYPDAVEYLDEDTKDLDYETTCYNLAEHVVYDFESYQQKRYFGEYFTDVDTCVAYLKSHFDTIYDACINYV